MAYSQAWLEANTARRIVIIEIVASLVAGGTQTLYFSNSTYTTTSADIAIYPILTGGLNFAENINLDGSVTLTYGDIELTNTGTFDYLIRTVGQLYNWPNSAVSIYYGDESFICTNIAQVKTDFELIFSGVVIDVASRNPTTINIKLADKLQKLNQPISETKLGTYGTWGTGAQPNADSVLPIIFGEVFNISPMYIDPSLMEYIVHNGNIEQLIEVRDNGVPVAATSLAGGKFRLISPAVGTVTASVQGSKESVTFSSPTVSTANSATYINNIASIIATIVTNYGGNTSNRLTLSDIDTANFYTHYTTNTQSIGISISDKENILEVCNRVLSSIGGQLYCTRKGLLQILVLGVPNANDASVSITTSDMVAGSFGPSEYIRPVGAVKLGYAKNWTVQEGLITAIPDAHKTSYATEWLTYTSSNSTAIASYKLSGEANQEDTLLLTLANATTEADRRKTYYTKPLIVYGFTGTSKLLSLKLGQAVTITHPRYNLHTGVSGQVISLRQNWLKGTVDVEVII